MIYISGQITGTDDYMERFAAAEKELADKGHYAVNPARYNAQLPSDAMDYYGYMRISLALLDQCSGIYMLDGWRDSKGARLEYAYAEAMGKEITYQTPPTTQEEKKYYYRINADFGDRSYLNYTPDSKQLFLNTKEETKRQKTKFTELEFATLAKRFHIQEDMFVKEEIE